MNCKDDDSVADLISQCNNTKKELHLNLYTDAKNNRTTPTEALDLNAISFQLGTLMMAEYEDDNSDSEDSSSSSSCEDDDDADRVTNSTTKVTHIDSIVTSSPAFPQEHHTGDIVGPSAPSVDTTTVDGTAQPPTSAPINASTSANQEEDGGGGAIIDQPLVSLSSSAQGNVDTNGGDSNNATANSAPSAADDFDFFSMLAAHEKKEETADAAWTYVVQPLCLNCICMFLNRSVCVSIRFSRSLTLCVCVCVCY